MSNKQTIQDYCKEHRVWAAKDDIWCSYSKRPKYVPVIGNADHKVWSANWYWNVLDKESLIFPDVAPEKSLVAPDGRFILINPKKSKQHKLTHFKVGHWYQKQKSLNYESEVCNKPFKCIKVTKVACFSDSDTAFIADLQYDKKLILKASDDNGFVEVPAPHLKKLKKYDLVFAWNDNFNERTPPAIETYWGDAKFVTRPKVHVVFPNGRYMELKGKSKNEEYNFMISNGWLYDYILPFDVSLIGVPIKDLPKEENNNE